MISKEVWKSLNKVDKRLRVVDCLNQLFAIETNTHELSNKPEQGRLCNVKKDLEQFLVNVADWEK